MIRCVAKSYGFAHICDGCGVTGPIAGDSPVMRDSSEAKQLGYECRGVRGWCLAADVGWLTGGERDLCPECRAAAPK